MRVMDIAALDLPDPMHPKPWEEEVVPRHLDFHRRLEDAEAARREELATRAPAEAENERLRRERGEAWRRAHVGPPPGGRPRPRQRTRRARDV